LKKKCLEYAEKADLVNSHMQSDLLELSEPINCDTLADVDNALKYLDNMEKEHKARDPAIDECQKIHDEVKDFEDPQIFASVGQKDLKDRFDEELKKIAERRDNLGLEKKRIFNDIEEQKKRKEAAELENKKTEEDYKKRAKELLFWIDVKEKEFDDPQILDFGKNIKEVEDNQDKYQDYKKAKNKIKLKKEWLEVMLINLNQNKDLKT